MTGNIDRAPAAPIIAAVSVTKLDARHRGAVLVAGSHGGIYAAWLAAEGGARAVILNDAGIGKDQAGIASLAYLDRIGMAAATVAYDSARIGDGEDMLARGVISHANAAARACAVAPGQACREAAERLTRAAMPHSRPEPYAEARFLLRARPGEPEVWGLDSASLIEPGDAGRVLVIGSHGALMGGKPEAALKHDALAAVFNDAGIGRDGAGITRLPALAGRSIAAATVGCDSARIGDARSSWDTGVISHVNDIAAAAGAAPGMTVPAFADRVIACVSRRSSPPRHQDTK